MHRLSIVLLCLALVAPAGCKKQEVATTEAEATMRDGQPLAKARPTALYSPKFVIRALAADGEHLYVTGLEFPGGDEAGEGEPTGVVVKVPLLGVPEVLAEGPFIPEMRLALIGDRLYWHERHDSPDGRGLRSLATSGGEIEQVSELCGDSWVIHPTAVYFTRPADEIDEGGFYMLERGARKAQLVGRRRGVVRTLLGGANDQKLYWTTRARRDGTWAVYEWDGAKSGTELFSSDETFASLAVDGEDFLWVTWAEDAGQPLHSLYRRPIAGGDIEVLARKRGLPGFMEVFVDERHIYLTTIRGGELRRLPKSGTELEILTGSGDRLVTDNANNLFWVDDKRVYWMAK